MNDQGRPMNWMQANSFRRRGVRIQRQDSGGWHDVAEITEDMRDSAFRAVPGQNLLIRTDGDVVGPAMTARELIAFLATVPPETLLAWTWQGVYLPVRFARMAHPPQYATPFVELDVDGD